ncbi:MAG TPA: hypothetical protein VM600_06215 [Actinomycetota bacterium]|nr:hypothetical protein [Actinomycetota bacterium]
MRKRILGLGLIAVLALGFAPASAGPITAHVRMTRGAFVYGEIPGGIGFAILARFEQLRVYDPGRILPMDAMPQVDPNLGVGPQDAGDPIFTGCIGIVTTLGWDTNCKELEKVRSPEEALKLFRFDNLPKITPLSTFPATMNVDPALTSGEMTFSALSPYTGRRLTAIAVLNGVGDLVGDPRVGHKTTPGTTPMPASFFLDGRVALQREASARSGTIKHEVFGGGPIKASIGAMFMGPATDVTANLSGWVCAAPPPLGGCP